MTYLFWLSGAQLERIAPEFSSAVSPRVDGLQLFLGNGRGKCFGKLLPLAARAQNVTDRLHHLT